MNGKSKNEYFVCVCHHSEQKKKRTPLLNLLHKYEESRDSSVGTALGYGLDERGSRVRFPSGDGNFSLHHRVQNGSGAYPAPYPVGTRGSFPGSKATGA
jgi:hypothetical protein